MTFAALGMLLFAGVVLFSLMGAQSEKQAPPVPEPIVTQAPAEVPVMIAEDGGTGKNLDELDEIRPDGAEASLQVPEQDGRPETLLAIMPPTPNASGQYETRLQPQSIPNDDTQLIGQNASIKKVAYSSLADASEDKPVNTSAPERSVTRQNDVPAKTPSPPEASIDPIGEGRPEATESVTEHAPVVSSSVEQKRGESVDGSVSGISKIDLSDVKIKREGVTPAPGVDVNADLAGITPDTGNGTNDIIAGGNQGEGEANQHVDIYAERDEIVIETGAEKRQNRIATVSLPGTVQRDNRRMEAYPLADVDTPPRLIKSYPLQYPYLAKRDDISGSITLKFIVTKEGNAIGTTVVDSKPQGVFDETALQAIEQYRFKPGIKDGLAVDVKVNLPIKFNLM